MTTSLSRYRWLASPLGVLGAAVAAGALLSGGVPTASAAPHARAVAAIGTQVITEVTGDQVRLRTGGGEPVVSALPAVTRSGRIADNMSVTFDVSGDIYVIPGDALPYIGSVLDPRLFDVSYLQRAGLTSAPTKITWRTRTHPALTAGLLSELNQIKKVSLATPPAATEPPAALASSLSGNTKLFTLKVHVLDHAGNPTAGLVVIQNLDNLGDYYGFASVTASQPADVTVPVGRYAVEALSYDTDSLGLATDISLVTADEVSVSDNVALTLSARHAVPVTVSVPNKNAQAGLAEMSFTRRSARGGGLSAYIDEWGPGLSTKLAPVGMYVQPTPRPALGTLGFASSWLLEPPNAGLPDPAPDAPYAYSLDFASPDGIPAQQSHVLTAADLTTVHDSFAGLSSGDGQTSWSTPYHTWGQFAFQLYTSWYAFTTPASRTDYFGGSASTVWQQMTELIPPPIPNMVPVSSPMGPLRTFSAGQRLSLTWGEGPVVPVPEWQDMGLPNTTAGGGALGGTSSQYYVCPVCRQGNLLAFNAQLADSDPTHADWADGYGSGLVGSSNPSPTDSLKFYRNGVLTQLSGLSGQVYPLLAGKARYELDWSSTPSPVWNGLGTSVDSVWGFSSAPAGPSRLPGYEYCAPQTTQACSFVPLVFASYDFGTQLDEHVPAGGTHTFRVTGYHEAGITNPAVTRASVQVSYDDGRTWAPANVVSLGGGAFRVTVTQPAASGYASVRVSLTDAAGDTLRQTIIHAYALTAR